MLQRLLDPWARTGSHRTDSGFMVVWSADGQRMGGLRGRDRTACVGGSGNSRRGTIKTRPQDDSRVTHNSGGAGCSRWRVGQAVRSGGILGWDDGIEHHAGFRQRSAEGRVGQCYARVGTAAATMRVSTCRHQRQSAGARRPAASLPRCLLSACHLPAICLVSLSQSLPRGAYLALRCLPLPSGASPDGPALIGARDPVRCVTSPPGRSFLGGLVACSRAPLHLTSSHHHRGPPLPDPPVSQLHRTTMASKKDMRRVDLSTSPSPRASLLGALVRIRAAVNQGQTPGHATCHVY